MAKSRSAYHSLSGYRYQFDKAIVTISEASRNESVTMEGIEDIDVGSHDFIQCKYHATKKYTPSSIRKPIMEFLRHYIDNRGQSIQPQYTLYAHFSDIQTQSPISSHDIISMIQNHHEEHHITIVELQKFVSDHLRVKIGPNLEDQEKLAKNAKRHAQKTNSKIHASPVVIMSEIRKA